MAGLDVKAGVILADPPWKYANFTKAAHGAAVNHYGCMAYDHIAALPVPELWAADDCILAVWGTWPKLDEGVALVKAWGFEYVTGLPWVKTLPKGGDIATGIGFWWQSASEVLLIGRRGKPKRTKQPAVLGLLSGENRQFYAPKTRHSQKHDDIHTYLESRYEGPYLELFARRPRAGWECWGNELGYHLSHTGVRYEAPTFSLDGGAT